MVAIPYPIPTVGGSLDGWDGTDWLVLPAGSSGTLTELFVTVNAAPSGGSVSVSLRDAQGGGGNGLDATIADGAFHAVATGSVALAASEDAYFRIVSASGGAYGLSGYFKFDGDVPVLVGFTTRERVKSMRGITVTTYDDTIDDLIADVGDAMQRWMDRTILQTAHTAEKLSGNGQSPVLQARHFPIVQSPAPVLYDVDGDVIPTDDYEVDHASGQYFRKNGGRVGGAWSAGRRNFSHDYTSGIQPVPGSLVNAATKQVGHELLQWAKSAGGEDRLGDLARSPTTGGSVTYAEDRFLPAVIEAMQPFRRLA